MLELIVWRELNQCKKERKSINNFRSRIRPIVSNCEYLEDQISYVEHAAFDMVWMNYFLNTPATIPLELEVLAVRNEEKLTPSIAFETKNRNEKNLPSIEECKIFMNKLDIFQKTMEQKNSMSIYGIYFSANGFSSETETWLHDHGILTVDWETWIE